MTLIVAIMLGSVFFGLLAGQVISRTIREDASNRELQARLDAINKLSAAFDIPSDLCERLKRHIIYVKQHSTAHTISLEILTPSLRRDVMLRTRAGLVKKIPLLSEASDSFVVELALCLNWEIASPKDEILRDGSIPPGAWLVLDGALEVLSPHTLTHNRPRTPPRCVL